MAQSGYTPISIYYSTTASAVPTAGNLANGELALNTADMKLYAKNSSGTVTLLASNGSTGATVSSVSGTGTVNGLTLTGTVTTSGSLTLGGTLSLVSPPAIGSTTPNTGAFTTLSASGTISASGLIKFAGYSADVDDFGLYAKSGQGTVLAAASSNSVTTRVGTANITSVSSTGLAVTGTLSSTNYGTFKNLRIGVDGGNDIYSSASANLYYSTSGNSYAHSFGNASASTYCQLSYTTQIFYSSNVERARVQTGFSVGTTADPGAGAIYATGNITAYYSSDIKFKENVRDIPDALATVNAIGGKLFDWTDEYIESKGGADGYFVQKADFGVVAQDVQKVFPIAVRTRPDGSLAVDYEKLGALAFAALVELTKRVEALETK